MTDSRHRLRRRTAAALALVLAAAGAASPNHARAADPPAVTTRSYSIRDLLVPIPDFYGPQFGLGPGYATGQPRPPATMPTREELAGDLTAAVRGSVAPETWREAGGTVGSIREWNGELVVTQTDDNHRRVAELLQLLRDARAVQWTVETRFLTADADTLDANVRAMLDSSAGGDGGTFHDPQQTQDMLRELRKTKGYTLLTAPRLTLFSGQTAYVLVAVSSPFVPGYARMQTEGLAARYEAVPSVANSGVMLEVQGAVSADRKSVALTVRPRVTAVGGTEKLPFDADPSLSVDRPAVREVGIDTSMIVPTGKTVILRMAPADKGAKGMTYVLLTPTVIPPRDPAAHDSPPALLAPEK